MKKLFSFLSLFSSLSTLLCCALPALFVVLGLGASFAGFLGKFPQLIWVSENKGYFFVFGAIALTTSAILQWRSRSLACPVDPNLAEACKETRGWSFYVFIGSTVLYLTGLLFAYILPAVL